MPRSRSRLFSTLFREWNNRIEHLLESSGLPDFHKLRRGVAYLVLLTFGAADGALLYEADIAPFGAYWTAHTHIQIVLTTQIIPTKVAARVR